MLIWLTDTIFSLLQGEVHRVMSLRNPLQKMSKSDNQETSRINLSDSPDQIKMKIRKAVTDCQSEVTYDPETRPGVSNLVAIYSAVTGLKQQEVVDMFIGKDTLQLKDSLTDVLVDHLRPVREELERLDREEGYVREVLHKGGVRADECARETMGLVKGTLGID